MWHLGETHVFPATGAKLRVLASTWAFAERHRGEIAAHWERRVREAPRFFNGTVYVLAAYSLSPSGLLSADFLRTDFASFLYWRETGWPDCGVMDAFGTALVFSSDGRLLLGKQRAGNLNGSAIYPPSGFIDPTDILADGTIDIDASVLREVTEETGLDAAEFRPSGSYIVTKVGPVLSIGVGLHSPLPAAALQDRIARHIAADPDSELVQTVFVEPGETLPGHAMPDYVRALLRSFPGLKTLP